MSLTSYTCVNDDQQVISLTCMCFACGDLSLIEDRCNQCMAEWYVKQSTHSRSKTHLDLQTKPSVMVSRLDQLER